MDRGLMYVSDKDITMDFHSSDSFPMQMNFLATGETQILVVTHITQQVRTPSEPRVLLYAQRYENQAELRFVHC